MGTDCGGGTGSAASRAARVGRRTRGGCRQLRCSELAARGRSDALKRACRLHCVSPSRRRPAARTRAQRIARRPGGLLRDGNRAIAVKIYSRTANGATASADDLAKAQADADKSLATDDYVLPLREDRLADYRIANATCDQCAAGSQAIRFTSLKRDQSHGDGTIVLDSATHTILRVDFVPSALPKHVDSASVTLTFGRVLPDLWDETEMHEHYTGHVLFISGGAEIVTTLSGYRRFASRDDGLQALATGI